MTGENGRSARNVRSCLPSYLKESSLYEFYRRIILFVEGRSLPLSKIDSGKTDYLVPEGSFHTILPGL